ncbi:MAG: [protein-PII] uridylyltransferase [Candidatus Hydrogenedentes bacterium]|nr:[protein-PII] uridylyltransferase [Candidatus Hydrogenedentota bacterium]
MTRSFNELVSLATLDSEAFESVSRQECVEAARAYITQRRAIVQDRHTRGESGSNVVRMLAEIADSVLRGILRFGLASVPNGRNLMDRASLCALGGYGRAELSPYSDLDVCLLYDGALDENLTCLNSYLVPFLWDIGVPVGYAIRSVREALDLANEDLKAFTSFLECRLIAGDNTVYARLKLSMRELLARGFPDTFIKTKIRERHEELPAELQDLYRPDPQIKENAGGLRDFHTAIWLLMVSHGLGSLDEAVSQELVDPEEQLDFVEGLDFIWRIRNELHFHAGKVDDRLSFENQRHVAAAFGYTTAGAQNVSRFMQDYYAAARQLRRFLRIAARLCNYQASANLLDSPRPQVPAIAIEDGEIYAGLGDENWFAEQPARVMEVFWECARHMAVLSRPTERMVTANLALVGPTFQSNDLVRRFFTAICNRPFQAGHALRQAANVGLLGRYLPEFAAIQGIIRYEDFHHYPVDEHTLRAIEALARLQDDEGPVIGCLHKAIEHLSDPYILVMAVLFHDFGKAAGEIHIEQGVLLARQICKRMGMSEDDEDRIAFLVRHHQLMTEISQYRDIDDDDIVRSFATTMKSEQRLRALFILSYADLSAVGPDVWTDWKGALLLKLYLKSERILLGRSESMEEEYWKAQKAQEAAEQLKPELRPRVQEQLRFLGERYFFAFSPHHIAIHVECVAEAEQTGLAVRCTQNPETGMSEVVVSTQDQHGLFSKIAGSFTSQLVDVNGAALFTRPDGFVVDCFTVTDARFRRPLTEEEFKAFERVLRAVLLENQDIQTYVDQSRRRLFALLQPRTQVRTRVEFDNNSSRSHTVVDIETGDRTGLLYDITHALAKEGLDIASAHIATDARRVRDSFYVTMGNSKIVDEEAQAVIRDGLLDAIHPRPAVETKGGSQ